MLWLFYLALSVFSSGSSKSEQVWEFAAVTDGLDCSYSTLLALALFSAGQILFVLLRPSNGGHVPGQTKQSTQ